MVLADLRKGKRRDMAAMVQCTSTVRVHPCIAKRLHSILVEETIVLVSKVEREQCIDRFREDCVLLSQSPSSQRGPVHQVHSMVATRQTSDLIMEYMHWTT